MTGVAGVSYPSRASRLSSAEVGGQRRESYDLKMKPENLDLSRYVVLEIDGPDVSPQTLEAPAFLELAAAFFQLLIANADDDGERLSLTDVRIIDKCVAVIARPDRFDVAHMCVTDALRQISGGDPPKGGAVFVERTRVAVRRLAPELHAKVLLGTLHLDIVVDADAATEPLDSILSIRATPIRIGGRRPAVRFRSDIEEDFTLDATQDVARAVGAHLYREVDIDAMVRRAADGSILSGRLTSFEPVATGDPRPAWRAWFRSVGGDESDDERTGLDQ